MANQVTNYQCPACTGPLHFEESTGKLQCDYCESSYTVEEIEALFAEKNQQAQAASEQEAASEQKTASEADDTSEWGEGAERMRAYNCPSCGAELICEETTAATSCPYCGNPTVVPGQFGGTMRPDYIIPFKVSKEEAVAALKKHYKGKLLLPKAFASDNHLQEIKGIYVPFWLFDAKAAADTQFKTTRSHTHRTPNERIITTDHFLVDRQGTVEFHRIPVDGASKMPDSHMDAIEPFDYRELKEFSMAYLPGFFADKYDVTAQECQARADERCRASAVQAMEDSILGYETRICVRSDVKLDMGQVKYALFPVWLLSTKWKDQTHLFAMNGQSGKFIGDLPISWGRFWAWFAGIYAGVAALLALILL